MTCQGRTHVMIEIISVLETSSVVVVVAAAAIVSVVVILVYRHRSYPIIEDCDRQRCKFRPAQKDSNGYHGQCQYEEGGNFY